MGDGVRNVTYRTELHGVCRDEERSLSSEKGINRDKWHEVTGWMRWSPSPKPQAPGISVAENVRMRMGGRGRELPPPGPRAPLLLLFSLGREAVLVSFLPRQPPVGAVSRLDRCEVDSGGPHRLCSELGPLFHSRSFGNSRAWGGSFFTQPLRSAFFKSLEVETRLGFTGLPNVCLDGARLPKPSHFPDVFISISFPLYGPPNQSYLKPDF